MKIRKFLLICTTIFLLLIPLAPPAFAVDTGTVNNLIQGGHSGSWYDVVQPGHGLFVEVIDSKDSPTGKGVVAAWFAFINGERTWVLGLGDVVPIDGGFRAELDAYVYDGNDFPPYYDPDMTTQISWGTLLLSFTGCDQAMLEWDSTLPEYGSGLLELRRLTSISSSTCIPDLGGEMKQDDHGDSWQSGTYLSDIGRIVKEVKGKLEENGDVDVFVFTLTSRETVKLFTSGPTDTDTLAKLFEIVDFEEDEILESDDNPVDEGFFIEKVLDPGTYSVHVSGKDDLERGSYYLYYKTEAD